MSKQELRQFVKEHNFQSAEDIQKTLKELFADVLQEVLEAELLYASRLREARCEKQADK